MHEHHGHEHHHDIMSKEETLATLDYMLKHNRHHADEMRELAHNLEHLDLQAAADAVKESAGIYDKGSDKLDAALKLLKGE